LTLDFLPPMRSVFLLMKRFELQRKVLDVNLFMCHIWNDHPELGWGVHVTTDGDQALAERIADHIAEAAWSVRHHGLPTAPMAEEAIEQVRQARWQRRLGTVCISDVSDVVGAGAAGENPRLVEALLEHARDLVSYAPIRDAEAVAELWSMPVGSRVERTLGGRLHPEMNPPLPVVGRLAAKKQLDGFGRVVRLDLGHVQLAVTEGPPLVMKPGFYRSLGLEPMRADICVVKSFFPFRIYFALENRMTIYARTRGVTDFEVIHDLELTDRVFPMARLGDWREVDRRRRAGEPPPDITG
jgi:microcystin degradation protein MlrC